MGLPEQCVYSVRLDVHNSQQLPFLLEFMASQFGVFLEQESGFFLSLELQKFCFLSSGNRWTPVCRNLNTNITQIFITLLLTHQICYITLDAQLFAERQRLPWPSREKCVRIILVQWRQWMIVGGIVHSPFIFKKKLQRVMYYIRDDHVLESCGCMVTSHDVMMSSHCLLPLAAYTGGVIDLMLLYKRNTPDTLHNTS